MSEQLISFQNQGQTLFGMIHIPPGAGPFPAVLIFHGFTADRNEHHFLLVKAARALMAAGLVVLRFDFRGSGESEGDFSQVTIEGEISDGLAARAWLRGHPAVDPDLVGVCGISVGGAVAACLAGRTQDVPSLVLWAPVGDPARVFSQAGSGSGSGFAPVPVEGGMDIGGLIIGQGMIADVLRLRPAAEVVGHPGAVLIIQGTADQTVPPYNGEMYREALGERCTLVWIEGADHTFSRTWWEQEVIRLTVAHFRGQLAPAA
ncbi:MAG: alpha/beta fold hydrolase [Anaerolineae bacterium]